MKKSILAAMTAAAALVIALCLLSGCTGSGGAETGTAAETAAETESTSTGGTASAAESEPGDGTATAAESETDTDTETETEPAATDYFEASRIDITEPDTSLAADMAIAGDGYDIYLLTDGKEWGYRYGCTYLYNEDGSVDAYFACVGTVSGEWDWISYRHSPDGGATWENEKVVLTPTQDSMDHYSNCDPGVVYFNGYYYLGYTSTLNSSGYCNNLFVARSENPDGPFEKWNGSGWGGPDCQPIVYFDENWESWGIGEPSFVELNGTLYLYYTCTAPSGSYTMAATADAANENWPATLQFHGMACSKGSDDSLDIKYVEEWGKFIGVCTSDRMSASSCLAVYESNDGLTFEPVDYVKEGTYRYLHNAGISSRPNGHIRLSEDADRLCVIYAYGEGWGVWNTRVQPVTLTLSSGNDLAAERAKSNIPDPRNRAQLTSKRKRYTAMIRTEQDVYEYDLSRGSFTPLVYAYDTYFERDRCRMDLTYSDYDTDVIRFEGEEAVIVGVGETSVTVTAENGLKNIFWVRITDAAETGGGSTATAFLPVRDTYTIYYGERTTFRPQIRGRIQWDNGTFTELFVDKQEGYSLTFEGYDDSVIKVSGTGIVTARGIGETDVAVTWNGMAFAVHVVVTDDPDAGYFSKTAAEALQDCATLDFTSKITLNIIGQKHNASAAVTDRGTCLTAAGEDVQCWLDYYRFDYIDTAEYTAIEITYTVPADVSSDVRQMQLFIMCGDDGSPAESDSAKLPVLADGESHTVRLELKGKSYWHDNLYAVRFDFFDRSSVGDCMYLQSVKLVKEALPDKQ